MRIRVPLGRLLPFALIAGVVAIVLVALVGIVVPMAAVQGWLVATAFFLGLSLGALVIIAIHNLSGGRWGDALRPVLLAIAGALPVPVAAMAVPIVGYRAILPWLSLPVGGLPQHVQAKLAYFDPAFLTLRTLVVLLLWLAAAWLLGVWTPRSQSSITSRSVIALVIIMVTTMIFATDWMLAAEPEFYSTIYPVIETAGEVAGTFALAILAVIAGGAFRNTTEPEQGVSLAEDLANLLFGFVLLWVYVSFMQWLIIWSGNLPDEIGWYLTREKGVWPAVLLALILLHFVAPTATLLSGRIKRSPQSLAIVAAIALAGHLLDVVWRIAPSHHGGIAELATGIVAFVGIGGLWLAGCMWLLGGRLSAAIRRPARV